MPHFASCFIVCRFIISQLTPILSIIVLFNLRDNCDKVLGGGVGEGGRVRVGVRNCLLLCWCHWHGLYQSHQYRSWVWIHIPESVHVLMNIIINQWLWYLVRCLVRCPQWVYLCVRGSYPWGVFPGVQTVVYIVYMVRGWFNPVSIYTRHYYVGIAMYVIPDWLCNDQGFLYMRVSPRGWRCTYMRHDCVYDRARLCNLHLFHVLQRLQIDCIITEWCFSNRW